MIDQPSLAILIDCWDEKQNEYLIKFHARIIEFIEKNDFIKTIILASYNCRAEREKGNSIWYRNYVQMFNVNATNRNIKDLEYVHRVYEKYDIRFPMETTSTTILNYLNPNKFQIAMQWGWELKHYLELNPDIKNIYVLGSSWDMCVKIRPLGYEALQELEDINILTESSCVAPMKHSQLIIEKPWVNVTDNIFYLQYEQR
jgi:hypothetical protein